MDDTYLSELLVLELEAIYLGLEGRCEVWEIKGLVIKEISKVID